MGLYDNNFYGIVRDTAGESCKYVLEALKQNLLIDINSAVDLGCGVGAWLKGVRSVFSHTARLQGYDGDYVDRALLEIPESCFTPWDLSMKVPSSVRYDIAISLEVAEHIDIEYADILVDSLVDLSDLVLFSAAVPYQGGVNHINEQPLSYWKEKFEARNYKMYDVIRPIIWDNPIVSMWYKQNTVVFCNCNAQPLIREVSLSSPVDIIHPELFALRAVHPHKVSDAAIDKRLLCIGAINDLFDSLSTCRVAIRTGGIHSDRLLSMLSQKQRGCIHYVIDNNPECRCIKHNIPVVSTSEIPFSSIDVILIASLQLRDEFKAAAKEYPPGIQVVDLYDHLESIGLKCTTPFYSINS